MLSKGKAKKITIYLTDADRRHGELLYVALVGLARKHGLAGATVTHALMGFGASAHGGLRADRTDIPTPLPIKVEIVDSPEAIERFLPEVDAYVEDALVEVSEVDVVKVKPRPAPVQTEGGHMKLEGKAKMLRIHIGADDTWEGEPLHEALVKRFHFLDLAGVTVYRGMAGYGASGRVHRHKTLRHTDDPITVVVVDTAEKIEKAMPAIDEMVGSGMVAISDVDVVFYRVRPPGGSGGPGGSSGPIGKI